LASLGIDLSRLSAADLSRLRRAAQARGARDLTEQLDAELAVRRTAYPRPAVAAPDPSPDADADAAPAPRWPLALAGALGAALLAAGLGWQLARPSPPTAPPEAAAPRPVPASTAPAPQPAPAAQSEPVKPPPKAQAQPVRHRRAAAPCRLGRGTADRLVCASPRLAAQHRAMLRAYDRALAAGADRRRVDAGQAAWRKARARAHDTHTLAGLYRRRIHELEAVARRAERRR
jgi:hypothetical protein